MGIMKKALLTAIIFTSLFGAGFALAYEEIDSFNAIIKVNSNGTLNIEEQIRYDFGFADKHGIYRDIPVKYQARGGNYNLRISDIKVVDENGQPYKFSVSSQGQYQRIKIGDADKYITGQKTYIIKYKIGRAINYFREYDEIYWNATGNEWQAPILASSAKVILPAGVNLDLVKTDCFAGTIGNTEKCSGINIVPADSSEPSGMIEFSQTALPSYQGLTIVVGVPKGVITPPSGLTRAIEFLQDNLILFLPAAVFIIFFTIWWKKGKDPRGRGTIIAQYDAPDNLTPAEAGTIIDERVHDKDVSAEIVHLAIKGYLKIRRVEKKILFAKSIDYELVKLKEDEGLENDFDRKLFRSIFNIKDKVDLAYLKKDFFKSTKEIKDLIYKSVTKKGYFVSHPNKARASYIFIGIIFLFPIIFGARFLNNFTIFISLLLTGLLIMFFSLIMPKRTLKGVLAKEHILGLRDYLETAEKERIKFHDAPEKNPALFEKLLPMAMVLGVEKEWAAQFKDIYLNQPSWYEGPAGTGFNSIIFVGSLNFFASAAHGAMSSQGGAAGGRSGFGGGGFSGGGFGGGGGGSW
ncbi:DUF2207 domain-containing protein [Patescibacteria group bacterium]|nr:DUF2207 domain-containing protein [Patescibacteria group bacterium]